jgi:hypothetical protein
MGVLSINAEGQLEIVDGGDYAAALPFLDGVYFALMEAGSHPKHERDSIHKKRGNKKVRLEELEHCPRCYLAKQFLDAAHEAVRLAADGQWPRAALLLYQIGQLDRDLREQGHELNIQEKLSAAEAFQRNGRAVHAFDDEANTEARAWYDEHRTGYPSASAAASAYERTPKSMRAEYSTIERWFREWDSVNRKAIPV